MTSRRAFINELPDVHLGAVLRGIPMAGCRKCIRRLSLLRWVSGEGESNYSVEAGHATRLVQRLLNVKVNPTSKRAHCGQNTTRLKPSGWRLGESTELERDESTSNTVVTASPSLASLFHVSHPNSRHITCNLEVNLDKSLATLLPRKTLVRVQTPSISTLFQKFEHFHPCSVVRLHHRPSRLLHLRPDKGHQALIDLHQLLTSSDCLGLNVPARFSDTPFSTAEAILPVQLPTAAHIEATGARIFTGIESDSPEV
jgi:hypothetical protein